MSPAETVEQLGHDCCKKPTNQTTKNNDPHPPPQVFTLTEQPCEDQHSGRPGLSTVTSQSLAKGRAEAVKTCTAFSMGHLAQRFTLEYTRPVDKG